MTAVLTLLLSCALLPTSSGSGLASASAVQGPPEPLCGRVIDVSCTGPSSAVTIVLADTLTNSNRRVVIPAEYRHLFARVEDRYDQHLVCVASNRAMSPASEGVVRDPSELVVKDAGQATFAVLTDAARTCDPDVQPPVLVKDVTPQYTVDGMRAKAHGSIFLRGVGDRSGSVRDVRVMQSLEPSLDIAAREAFERWQFRPATRGAEPVAIVISVQMTFTMR